MLFYLLKLLVIFVDKNLDAKIEELTIEVEKAKLKAEKAERRIDQEAKKAEQRIEQAEQRVQALERDRIVLGETKHLGSELFRTIESIVPMVPPDYVVASKMPSLSDFPANPKYEADIQTSLFNFFLKVVDACGVNHLYDVCDTSMDTVPSVFLPPDALMDLTLFDKNARHWPGVILFCELKVKLEGDLYLDALAQIRKRFLALSVQQPTRLIFYGVISDGKYIEVLRGNGTQLPERTGLLPLVGQGYRCLDWLLHQPLMSLGWERFPGIACSVPLSICSAGTLFFFTSIFPIRLSQLINVSNALQQHARRPPLLFWGICSVNQEESQQVVIKCGLPSHPDSAIEVTAEAANINKLQLLKNSTLTDCLPTVHSVENFSILVGGETVTVPALFIQPLLPPLSCYIGYKPVSVTHACHTTSKRLGHQQISSLVARCAIFFEALHSSGFVHGDISPNNILVDKINVKPIVIDWSGMRRIGESRSSITATLMFVSTRVLIFLKPDTPIGQPFPDCTVLDDVESLFLTYLNLLLPDLPIFQPTRSVSVLLSNRALFFNKEKNWNEYFDQQLTKKAKGLSSHLAELAKAYNDQNGTLIMCLLRGSSG